MCRPLGLVRWNGAWGAPSSPSPSPPPSRGRRELEYVGWGELGAWVRWLTHPGKGCVARWVVVGGAVGTSRAQRSGTRTRSIARLVCDPCGVERFFYAIIPGCAARPGATGCNAFGIRRREGRRRFFVLVAYGHRQRMWRRLGLVRWNGAWGAPSSPTLLPRRAEGEGS